MYNYDPNSKALNIADYRVILQIDDNGNIMIYDKNSRGYDELLEMNRIEENRVLYEYSEYGKYISTSTDFNTVNCKGVEMRHSFVTGIIFNNQIRTSSDLINWTIEGNNKNLYKSFPLVSLNPNDSFQGRFGAKDYKIVGFKDYIYLIGLEEDFFEQNTDGCRNENRGSLTVSKDVYYRIHKNKDSSIGSNWEKIKTPWGERSSLDIRYDKNKIYVTKGQKSYYVHTPALWDYRTDSFESDRTIWSTTDGVHWKKETSYLDYDNANIIPSHTGYVPVGGDLPYIPSKVHTPEEPNWIKLNDGRYYKSGNFYETCIIDDIYYYVPIPPYEEIKKAYNSGQKYFTIAESHIKSAGLNQFLTKNKEPNKDEGWTVITPIDYADKLMVWQCGNEKMMLNINNKVIQLVDYYQIELMYRTIKDYSVVIEYLRKVAGKLRNLNDVLAAMEYEARADMLEFMKNNKEYIMPDEAVTHYKVEFKY